MSSIGRNNYGNHPEGTGQILRRRRPAGRHNYPYLGISAQNNTRKIEYDLWVPALGRTTCHGIAARHRQRMVFFFLSTVVNKNRRLSKGPTRAILISTGYDYILI